MGKSCAMLLFSVAALHKSLTQDATPLAGMGVKCAICSSCSLIHRIVLGKKLVAMWLL